MLHAAGLSRGVGQRNPGADLLFWFKAEIGAVLVPGGKGLGMRLLDEESAGPDQDVGTDHVLDRIQYARMADQVLNQGEWA